MRAADIAAYERWSRRAIPRGPEMVEMSRGSLEAIRREAWEAGCEHGRTEALAEGEQLPEPHPFAFGPMPPP